MPRVAPQWALDRLSPPAPEPDPLAGLPEPLVVGNEGDAVAARSSDGDTAPSGDADDEVVLSEWEGEPDVAAVGLSSPDVPAVVSADPVPGQALVAVVDDVRRELSERDGELVKVLERIVDAYEVLTDRLETDRKERLALVEVIVSIADHLAAIDSRFEVKPPRRSTVIGGTITPPTELSADLLPDDLQPRAATLSEGSG